MKRPDEVSLETALASLLGVRCSERPRLLWVSHSLGGGIERHLDELEGALTARALPLRLKPGCIPGRYILSVPFAGGADERNLLRLGFDWPRDRAHLLAWLAWLGVSRLHVHHLSGFSDELIRALLALKLPTDLTLHDHAILDDGRMAAGLARMTQEVARAAERVIAPSQAVATAVEKALPGLNIRVHPHPEAERNSPYPVPSVASLASGEALRVLCLGTFTPEKGATVLSDVARLAARRSEKVEFILLGESLYPLPGSVRQLGRYLDQSLMGWLEQLRPHVLWLPAQVPETWSYTLSAGLQAGLPIVASDIGAIPERLHGRPLTTLVAPGSTARVWLRELLAMRGAVQAYTSERPWPQQPVPAFYWSGGYLTSIVPERLQPEAPPVGMRAALALGAASPGWRVLAGWLARTVRKMPVVGHLVADAHMRRRLKRLILRS